MNKMQVHELKGWKEDVITKRYDDVEYRLQILAFPKKATKKEIYSWLERNGFESGYNKPCYEDDYYYYGSAGSIYETRIIRRRNKVYAIKCIDC